VIDCTVVVATYNRRRLLDATLTRLCALPEAPHVIVVDNGSEDGTAEFALARYPGVQLISLPSNIGAAARTVGARAAAARYVAFCDDDCWWQPGSLARAVQLLDAHPDVALLNARVVVHQSWIDPACDLMASSGLPKRTGCPGTAIGSFMAGASVVRRAAFLAAGGYEPRFHIGAEESLLALDLLDAGWELIYAADLILHHAPSDEGRQPQGRRLLVMRNRLWTAWLRRRWRVVWSSTAALARAGRRDPIARAALSAALRGLPWIVRARRPVGSRVERLLETITELPA
jgi:GT2 family glycosyltransferase